MIKKLTLFFASFFFLISFVSANAIEENLLEIAPPKGDINTQFEISTYFKPTESSTGLQYKFKPHDSAPSSNWRSSSIFKFRVHRKGTFRAHMLVRDSAGNVAEKTQIYKVFDELPKTIIQCKEKNKVGQKVIFDVSVPPNIVSMRPDFEGHTDWNLDFKPKTSWWWIYDKPGNYEVTFQLKDIYGKTSIIRKKIEILPNEDLENKKEKKSEDENSKSLEKKDSEKEAVKKKKEGDKKNSEEKPSAEVKIKVKVSHREQKVFEKFLFNASDSKGEKLTYEWRNPESKYPVVYGKQQLFYFETPGEKIITLKIIDKNGKTDEIKIPVTVKKADKEKDLQALVPDLLGTRKKKTADFKVRTGSNVPRPKFETGMRPGF